MACFNNEVTESTCFDGVVARPMGFGCVLDESRRTALLLRIGLLSLDEESRLRYEEERGEPLVPREFGGVRCRLVPSSV